MERTKLIRISIGTKLIIMFVLMITITLFILGVSTHQKSMEILKQNLKDSTLQIVYESQNAIQNYMRGIEASLNYMAYSKHIQQIYSDADMIESILEDFDKYIDTYNDVSFIYLGTKDSNMYVYPNTNLPTGYDPTQMGWYKEAASKNKFIWTQPYVDTFTGQIIISAAIPIYDMNHDFIGVLGIHIPLETVSDEVNRIQIGKEGYVSLIDGNGLTMTHLNKKLIGEPVPVEAINKMIQEKNEGILDYEWEENGNMVKKIAVFKKLDHLGWTVLATMNEDEIAEDTKILLDRTLFIGIVSTLVTVMISILFSKRLTGCIKNLSQLIHKITNFDLSDNHFSQVVMKSSDEIGIMANDLLNMKNVLKEMIKKIIDQSGELTNYAENISKSTNETALSIEDVAKTIEQLASGAVNQAKEVSDGTPKLNQLN